jgi:hypothetical protein
MKQRQYPTTLRKLPRFTVLTLPGCLLAMVILTSPSASIAIERSVSNKDGQSIAEMNGFSIATTDALTAGSQDPKGYKKTAKGLVDNLVAEDYEGVRENFNEQMRQGLSADQIAQTWTAAVQQLGSYRSQGSPQLIKDQGFDAVVIRCQMERGALTVEVVYDGEGKVGGLWIRPAQ